MNYIDINFNKIKGFNKLSAEQQRLFISTYKIHNSMHGNDYKAGWLPISVKLEKSYLIVVFLNGEWLHYTQRGEWY